MPEGLTRDQSKQRRRERILVAARELISRGGLEALSTRALAEAAGVTPPTLYNLIGNRDAILNALQMQTVAIIEARLAPLDEGPAIDRIEAIVEQSIELFSKDESFYRAGFLAAGELDEPFYHFGGGGELEVRSVRVASRACELAQRQGLLRGRLSASFLAEQMLRGYRTPFEDWANGFIDLDTCRRQALQGLYSSLFPDAVETFAAELTKRLARLEREASAARASEPKDKRTHP